VGSAALGVLGAGGSEGVSMTCIMPCRHGLAGLAQGQAWAALADWP